LPVFGNFYALAPEMLLRRHTSGGLTLHKISLALIALSVGLFSASQAKASTTDTFSLTGDGNTFTFSLLSPSTPSATNFGCPAGGFSDFCYSGISVIDNGHSQSDTIEFTSNGGLDIFNHYGQSIVELTLDHPPLEFADTKDSVSFIGGTYLLGGDDNGWGDYDWNSKSDCGNNYDGYTLSIDPPAPVPEPSSLALMSSGLLAAAGAVRRRMKK
jgi:PEP-CTERM motif